MTELKEKLYEPHINEPYYGPHFVGFIGAPHKLT
jgi:hypothetical protein